MLAGDLLGERARLTPERTALVEVATGERSTYRQLDQRATLLARAWTERWGIGRGDRVAILAHNGSPFLEAFFAAGKTGAVLVPLNSRLTAREHAGILVDCTPRVLLHGDDLAQAAADIGGLLPGLRTVPL